MSAPFRVWLTNSPRWRLVYAADLEAAEKYARRKYRGRFKSVRPIPRRQEES